MSATPGPWVVRDETDIWGHDPRFPDDPDAIKTLVARLYFVGEPVEHQSDPDRDFPETEANARLIAAAPALFEAAKAAIDACDCEMILNIRPGERDQIYCLICDQLRVAIALAEDGSR